MIADVLVVLGLIGFFVLASAYVALCERIVGDGDDEPRSAPVAPGDVEDRAT